MPRKKRSEKMMAVVLPRVEIERPEPEKVVGEVYSALCPLCGRAIPEKRSIKSGYAVVDHVGYFESIDWERGKPFGVAHPAAGRGSFRESRDVDISEVPEFFEQVKARLIDAVREWHSKGWLSDEDLAKMGV